MNYWYGDKEQITLEVIFTIEASLILQFSSLERHGLENPHEPRAMTSDMATTIFYSSGSTGMPKGAKLFAIDLNPIDSNLE